MGRSPVGKGCDGGGVVVVAGGVVIVVDGVETRLTRVVMTVV